MYLQAWEKFKKVPLGKSVFAYLLGLKIPYSGSIRAEVVELELGRAKVKMKDRNLVRNHLNSVHAAALMNLAELTSGLAFFLALPTDAKAIVTEFKMQYKKKARGTLTAESTCEIPKSNEKKGYQVFAHIKDAQGDIVAIGEATWLVGPK